MKYIQVGEIFNTNHIRRHSDNGVKIHNSKDDYDYDVAEDWVDKWFAERGMTAPTYTETNIPIEEQNEVTQ